MNHSLQPADVVEAGYFRIGEYCSSFEQYNLTIGGHVELKHRTTVTVAYATPLGGGRDQQFDGELRVMLNRFFGPRTSLTRLPWF
jgi:hypothetical protein